MEAMFSNPIYVVSFTSTRVEAMALLVNRAYALPLIEALVDEHKRSKVAYATEGGHFQLAHMDTVICGPGSIVQAHKADEYIALSQLDRCDRFLQQLLQTFS